MRKWYSVWYMSTGNLHFFNEQLCLQAFVDWFECWFELLKFWFDFSVWRAFRGGYSIFKGVTTLRRSSPILLLRKRTCSYRFRTSVNCHDCGNVEKLKINTISPKILNYCSVSNWNWTTIFKINQITFQNSAWKHPKPINISENLQS